MADQGTNLTGKHGPGTPLRRARLRMGRLRDRLGPLWWYTLLTFGVNRMGDAVNVFIGLYLVPRLLPGQDLGALLPLMAIGSMFATPLSLLLLPVGKFLNVFAARGEHGKVRSLLEDSLAVAALFAVLVAMWLFWQGDGLLLRLQVSDRRLFWPIAGFAVLTCIDPVVSATLRALKLFNPMLWSGLVTPYVRLAGMLALLAPLGALGYLLAQLGVGMWGAGFGLTVVFLALRGMGRRASYRPHWREMLAFSLPLVALTVAARIQGPIEAFVIRHRLPVADSAGYYYAVMIGAIPGYFTAAMMPYFWPLISDRFERGESTRRLLLQSMLFNLALGALFVALFALTMPWFFTLPGPWRPYAPYAGFVWQAALIGTLKSAQGVYTAHEMACRRFTYMWHLVPLMLLESAVLYLLPAWSLARPWLPLSLWQWVAARAQPSLQLFVGIILTANAAFTGAMLIEWFWRSRRKGTRPRQSSTALDSSR
jgi:hypothetical protein